MKIKPALFSRYALAACLLGLWAAPAVVSAFTQHAGTELSNPLPMGHEWITRMAAIELLDPGAGIDPNDPRKKWPAGRGRAKNTDLSRAGAEVARIRQGTTSENTYQARYSKVWDAIIGERWVDLGGNNYTKSMSVYKYNCLDLVTQEPPEVQYDHYMRRPDDVDAKGGLNAAKASTQRFIQYFVAAATAPAGNMDVWDGGGYAVKVTVDRNYFLLGRALHLFEDSFSQDHTVRSVQDQYEKVRQVKSYLCASGSEQHAHPSGIPGYNEGDVIWNASSEHDSPGWSSYKPSNMKDVAIVAAEGSKDVWAAFIRTMAADPSLRAALAQKEAAVLAANWLAVNNDQETLNWYRDASHRGPTYVKSGNGADDGGNGTTQEACMQRDWKGVKQADKLKEFADGQRICLYNMMPTWGTENAVDRSLHLPFLWAWRDAVSFLQPPPNWVIGNPVYANIKLVNRVSGNYMTQENHYLYNEPSRRPLALFSVPLGPDFKPLASGFPMMAVGDEGWYMNWANTSWGLISLWNTANKGNFVFELRSDGYYNIKNVDTGLYIYMYADDKYTYLNKDGRPENANAQWGIEGLPEAYPGNGNYSIDTTSYGLRGNSGTVATVSGYDALTSTVNLMRQPDGSYAVKISGNYLRANPATHQMSWDASSGDTFFVEKQQDSTYLVRGRDGGYWNIGKRGTPIMTNASLTCPMDPCDPIISDPSQPLPPECRQPERSTCTVATPLPLKRYWQK